MRLSAIPEVTPPSATAVSPCRTFPVRCTSTLRARSKHRSIGAWITVTSSKVTAPRGLRCQDILNAFKAGTVAYAEKCVSYGELETDLWIWLLASAVLVAQETRREIVNPSPNPADDTKANSNLVPDVYAITGHFERIVILRFKYDTDLLAGMQKMVKQQKIRNAVILSALGSCEATRCTRYRIARFRLATRFSKTRPRLRISSA